MFLGMGFEAHCLCLSVTPTFHIHTLPEDQDDSQLLLQNFSCPHAAIFPAMTKMN